MHQLIKQVNEWANYRRIYENTTPAMQLALTYIELGEFSDALIKDESRKECAIELGDVIVCLINYCIMEKPELLINISKVLEEPEQRITSIKLGDNLVDAFNGLHQVEFFITYHIPELAGFVGKSPAECLRLAYEKIKFRKGAFKNGKFIKL